tara:strand:+ start:34017 stop:34499 length:483 start_codon:yes stop_codon:yes gene_type:complete
MSLTTYHIKDLLSLERTCCNVKLDSKKRVLQLASELICEQDPELNDKTLFDALIAREKLGSTCVGHGVAIPHARMANVDYIIGSLIHLKSPINFDNFDEVTVDIIFTLIVPEQATDEHLQVLSMLAKTFSDKGFRNCLRHAKNPAELYQKAIDYHDEYDH